MEFTVTDGSEPYEETLTEISSTDSITTAPYDYSDQAMEQDVGDIWEMPIALDHERESKKLSPLYDGRPSMVNNVIHKVSVLLHNITLVSEDASSHPDNQVESLIQR